MTFLSPTQCEHGGDGGGGWGQKTVDSATTTVTISE